MYAGITKSTAKQIRTAVLIITLVLGAAGVTSAMPPHATVLKAQAAAKAAGLSYSLPSTDDLHRRGICTPDNFMLNQVVMSASKGKSPAILGTFKALALLVDFSDNPSSVAPQFFDTLLFESRAGTMRDYFDEVSYGQLDIITVSLPSATGWTQVPQTYAYYSNSQGGTALTYPQNSQGLVEDLVDAVDGFVDFSQYDNDGDGYVDVLLVIHAGTGGELSGNGNDIWSHKWQITPRLKDGVLISKYAIMPELWYTPGDMTIGVYAHELSHGFGLPDLYDTDLSSYGIGDWGLMGYGSWNGSLGSSPAHLCAWSRIQTGFTSAVNVTSNRLSEAIASVNSGGSIFRLWNSGGLGNEYFLVENRQKIGYDAYLPGSGLLIWHIDDSKTNNRSEWYPGLPGSEHAIVALEQADGLFEMEYNGDQGDAADPFPGTGLKTALGDATAPTTDGYVSGATLVRITNISASAATMYADMSVGLAAGVDYPDQPIMPDQFTLEQNYPNPFNPLTTIQFSLDIPARVQLNIYNTLGQKIKTLWDGPADAGTTTLQWDASDNNGQKMASGVYFYELKAGNTDETKKMILVQ